MAIQKLRRFLSRRKLLFGIMAVVGITVAWPAWELRNSVPRMGALEQITEAGGDITAKCDDEDFDGLRMRSWLRHKMGDGVVVAIDLPASLAHERQHYSQLFPEAESISVLAGN